MKYPEIPVAVIDTSHDDGTRGPFSSNSMFGSMFGMNTSAAIASGKPFLAICIMDPKLRSMGETEEIAVKRLKELIKSQYAIGRGSHIKYTTISFDDELVEEVMGE